MTAFGARKQESEETTGRAWSSRFWSGYPLKRNRSVKQRTVYPELSSSVRANGSVNHRFTAQSFLIPSLTNLWNFCTSESIQAKNAHFYENNVKENHFKDLPLHWLVFLSRIALVDTIFPYLEQQRDDSYCLSRQDLWIVGHSGQLSSGKKISHVFCPLFFIFSWQFTEWHKCQKPVGREITRG